MSDVKEPAFTVVQEEESLQVREYVPMIIAEVTMEGERGKAINDGFRVLADYIFGKNDGGGKIEMTAPVTQTQQAAKGAKIEMTAPVTQQAEGDKWKVHFVMPAKYTMETLPKPLDKRIHIFEQPSYKAAVIRFSGFGSDKRLHEKTQILNSWVAQKSLKAKGDPVYAFYNPPWTLPFLRRNEIIIPLAD